LSRLLRARRRIRWRHPTSSESGHPGRRQLARFWPPPLATRLPADRLRRWFAFLVLAIRRVRGCPGAAQGRRCRRLTKPGAEQGSIRVIDGALYRRPPTAARRGRHRCDGPSGTACDGRPLSRGGLGGSPECWRRAPAAAASAAAGRRSAPVQPPARGRRRRCRQSRDRVAQHGRHLRPMPCTRRRPDRPMVP